MRYKLLTLFYARMNSKSYMLEDVGGIVVRKHHQAHRISIKLRQGQPPAVVVPRFATFDMGYRFALENREWIASHLQQMAAALKSNVYNEERPFSSRMHTVRFVRYQTRCVQAVRAEGGYEMRFPADTDFSSAQVQRQIRMFLTEMLRHEAKTYLPDRVAKLAADHGFKYNQMSVKNVHTRWGSCSAQNNINLNIHLMRLPEYLSDFVILHELCHTIHKNHGPQFHKLLDSLVGGNEKRFDKELNKYKIQI